MLCWAKCCDLRNNEKEQKEKRKGRHLSTGSSHPPDDGSAVGEHDQLRAWLCVDEKMKKWSSTSHRRVK